MDIKIFDEIRKQIDIVEVIGNYVPLSRVGKNLKGLCPFHSDNNPSMIVSPEKQIFTCFSCHASGDAFKFVMDYEKISFIDAVRKVCEICKVPLPKELVKNDFVKPVDKYEKLYNLMSDLVSFYSYQLKIDENSEPNKYLNSRNLTKEDLDYFKIGYSPESGIESIDYLKSKGYTDDEIISTGVGVDLGKGKIIDRLRGRIIFSITNSDGKVVAFSGRRLKNDNSAKYVNSPETVLFHKSNVLYNYSNALINCKRDGYCYIVEGFMDAIALHKSGLVHVVATMGTAFTSDHIKLLKQLKSEIRLLFDSDQPGQIATNKCIDSLMNQDLNIKVVVPLTNNKDVDEVLQTKGDKEVVKLVSDVESIVQYKINYYASLTNFMNHEDAKKFIKDSVKFMSEVHLEDIDIDFFIQQISKKSSISISIIKNEYKKLAKIPEYDFDNQEKFINHVQVEKVLDKYDLADHQILKMMIESPLAIAQYNRLGISLSSREARKLANLIIDKEYRAEEISYASLFAEADAETSRLLGQISREDFPDTNIEVLADIVGKKYLKKLDKEELLRQLAQETNPLKQAELGQKLIELTKNSK